MKHLSFFSVFALSLVFIGCDKDNDDDYNQPPVANATVIKAAGDSAGIVAKLNEFRVLAGDPLNNAPGVTGGRREVNWDGVPANLTNNNDFLFDFFGSADPALGNGRKRGLIMTPSGKSFRVDTTDFSEIDASYSNQFEAFSRKRLFNFMGTTVTDITFKVPGTNTNAFVKSFAVIFSDVDINNSTTLEFYSGNKSLGVFSAPVASQGFSLLGVGFPNDKVTRVKITSGNGILAAGTKDISDGGTKDLVVMDDFLYNEPQASN